MRPAGLRVEGPLGAPALVLANSLGTTAELWAPLMTELSARFRVARYELRGHGGTPAPPGPYDIADLGEDLLAVIDALGAERASIAGVSLGGMAAMWVASQHPGRVERLVLACTSAYLPPASSWHERAAAVRTGGTSQLREAALGRWFTPGFPVRRPEVAAAAAAMLGTADPEGYASCCEAIATMDLRPELGSISAPTLVIGGVSDPVVGVAESAGLAAAIPGAALTVLPEASHLALLEQPERFCSALVEHLAGNVAERGDAMRRQVLGDAHVDSSRGADTALTASFTRFITTYAWGEIWTRPVLDPRIRSCITLALLAGTGRLEELPLHLQGARRNGLSDSEIAEVLLHTAVYCGVPAARSAFEVARRVLGEGAGE